MNHRAPRAKKGKGVATTSTPSKGVITVEEEESYAHEEFVAKHESLACPSSGTSSRKRTSPSHLHRFYDKIKDMYPEFLQT